MQCVELSLWNCIATWRLLLSSLCMLFSDRMVLTLAGVRWPTLVLYDASAWHVSIWPPVFFLPLSGPVQVSCWEGRCSLCETPDCLSKHWRYVCSPPLPYRIWAPGIAGVLSRHQRVHLILFFVTLDFFCAFLRKSLISRPWLSTFHKDSKVYSLLAIVYLRDLTFHLLQHLWLPSCYFYAENDGIAKAHWHTCTPFILLFS